MTDSHRSEFDRAAKAAVDAVDAARQVGEQMGLFDSLRPAEERKRSGNKASSALSAWLAAQGFGSPSEALARHAGLHLDGPAEIKAMATVDMIEAWATRGEVSRGKNPQSLRFSPEMRAGLFWVVMKEMRQANEALMPYVAKKLTPDVAVTNNNQMMIRMPSSGTAAAAYAPPPLPSEKPAETLDFEAVETVKSEAGKSEGA